jgi:hypothetical protein
MGTLLAMGFLKGLLLVLSSCRFTFRGMGGRNGHFRLNRLTYAWTMF